ncbi:MAG: hypothetical protein WBW04_04705 [Nitrolancea sp.]
MNDWRLDIEDSVNAFLAVTELAGDPVTRTGIEIEFLPAPHHPGGLPKGKMAIYGFWCDGTWLKIGKAGPKSGPRFVSHHYNVSALSTLAKSLVTDPHMQNIHEFDLQSPGAWMRACTNRVNILLPATRGVPLLTLLEAFLHVRLKPRYEG